MPSDTSLKAWAAVDALASQYASNTPGLRIGQAGADATADLILAQATISTTIELLVPYTPPPPSAADHDHHTDPTPTATGSTCPVADEPDTTCETCSPPPRRATTYERHLHLIVAHGVRIHCQRLTPVEWHGIHLPSQPTPKAESERVDQPGLAELERLLGTHELLMEEPASEADRDLGPDPHRSSPHPSEHEQSGRDRTPVTLPPLDRSATCQIGVLHTRVGIVLNTAIRAWIAHPDTAVRLHGYDPVTGTIVVHDPTTYRPNARLARLIRARDGHCRFPGCTTDAARTDLDHVTPFPSGPTTTDHLVCLCRRHHTVKHHPGWAFTMTPDGICTWTTPLGRAHTTDPRNATAVAA